MFQTSSTKMSSGRQSLHLTVDNPPQSDIDKLCADIQADNIFESIVFNRCVLSSSNINAIISSITASSSIKSFFCYFTYSKFELSNTEAIVDMIKRNTNLSALSLSDFTNNPDLKFELIPQALLYNQTLTEIRFTLMSITSEQVDLLLTHIFSRSMTKHFTVAHKKNLSTKNILLAAEKLAAHKTIQSFDMRPYDWNDIKDEELNQLTSCLCANQSLTRLKLFSCSRKNVRIQNSALKVVIANPNMVAMESYELAKDAPPKVIMDIRKDIMNGFVNYVSNQDQNVFERYSPIRIFSDCFLGETALMARHDISATKVWAFAFAEVPVVAEFLYCCKDLPAEITNHLLTAWMHKIQGDEISARFLAGSLARAN